MRCFGEKNKNYHCKIVFLDETELLQEIQTSTLGQELLDVTSKHLNLLETSYFGLRYLDATNQTHWLDPNKKVARQLKDTDPFTLYFGVKFYASDPCKLLEEITRYQFFLQVKQDVLQGRLPVSFDLAAELGAFSVQSELGDYDPRRHQPGYIAEFRFLAHQTPELESRISELHKTIIGQIPSIAEANFLEKVKWLDMYGVDLHPVLGEDNVEYFLGLTPSGVIVLRNKTKVGNYFWPRITKVYFKGKYFMLRVRDKTNDESTYGFELPSKQACKHLWKCCVEHHAFFRLTQVTSPNSGKVFSLTSRFRHSGRTERQIQSDVLQQNRLQPRVTRVASRRFQRRVGQPDGIDSSLTDDGNKENEKLETQSNLSIPQPVHLPTSIYRASSMPNTSGGNDSPRSTRSAPWEDPRQRGLFSSSTNPSPRSVRSAGYKPRSHGYQRAPSVESEDSCDGRRKRHHHRSRNHHNRHNSDHGSDGSHVSKCSHSRSSSRRHSRSGSRHRDSGSESESSQRHRHRSRKHKSKSNYELVDSEAQWQEVQKQQKGRQVQMGQPQSAVIRDLSASTRKSGYVNSGMESESEANYIHRRRHRKHRSRSTSPSDVRKGGPPDELKKHFEYSLIDSNGMSVDQLRDIPYTKVETDAKPFKVKYSPNTRHKQRTASTSRHPNKGNAPSDHQKVPLRSEDEEEEEEDNVPPPSYIASSAHINGKPYSTSSPTSSTRSRTGADDRIVGYQQSFDLLGNRCQPMKPSTGQPGHLWRINRENSVADGIGVQHEHSDSGLGTEGHSVEGSYRSSPNGIPCLSASPATSSSSSSHYILPPRAPPHPPVSTTRASSVFPCTGSFQRIQQHNPSATRVIAGGHTGHYGASGNVSYNQQHVSSPPTLSQLPMNVGSAQGYNFAPKPMVNPSNGLLNGPMPHKQNKFVNLAPHNHFGQMNHTNDNQAVYNSQLGLPVGHSYHNSTPHHVTGVQSGKSGSYGGGPSFQSLPSFHYQSNGLMPTSHMAAYHTNMAHQHHNYDVWSNNQSRVDTNFVSNQMPVTANVCQTENNHEMSTEL